MEGGGKVLDELPEVYTLVSDVVEDGLVAVALILHITNLHLQSEVLGNLATLNHCGVFAALGLLELVHIHGTRDAVDALDVVGTLQVGFLHLQLDQSTSQRHHTDVVAGTGFHGDDVAFLQFQFIDVVVIALAGVLELHLHEVGGVDVARHVSQPVIGVQLAVLPADSLVAQAARASRLYFEVFCLFHVLYNIYGV